MKGLAVRKLLHICLGCDSSQKSVFWSVCNSYYLFFFYSQSEICLCLCSCWMPSVGECRPLWRFPWLWRVCREGWRGCRAWRTEPDTSQSPRPTTGKRTHCCRSAACSSPGGTGRCPAEERKTGPNRLNWLFSGWRSSLWMLLWLRLLVFRCQ